MGQAANYDRLCGANVTYDDQAAVVSVSRTTDIMLVREQTFNNAKLVFVYEYDDRIFE